MNKGTRNILSATLVCALLMIFAASAIADKVIWKYSDDKGNIHFVEYLSNVPAKFRSKAVKVTLETTESNESPSAGSSPQSSPPPQSSAPSEAAKKKIELQNKARQAVVQVAGLEKEISSMEPQCQALRVKANNLPVIANRQAAADCEQKLSELRTALEKANEYLETGVFAEAKDAGVARSDIEDAINSTKKELK